MNMGVFGIPGEIKKDEKEVARKVNPESDESHEDFPQDNSEINTNNNDNHASSKFVWCETDLLSNPDDDAHQEVDIYEENNESSGLEPKLNHYNKSKVNYVHTPIFYFWSVFLLHYYNKY